MSGRGPRLISVKRGTPIGSLDVGTLVKLEENGAPVEFYLAEHDYEKALNGNGRTLLVRKDAFSACAFGSSNAYAGSTLDLQITETWFQQLGSKIQAAAGTTEFYYTPGGTTDQYTVTTISRKAFQLSLTELGGTHQYARTEGAPLPISNLLKIAYRGTSAVTQWTRSPYCFGTGSVFAVYTNGNTTSRTNGESCYSRPCITLPAGMTVDENMLITG